MADLPASAVIASTPPQQAQLLVLDGQDLYYVQTIAAAGTTGTTLSFFNTQSANANVTNVQAGNQLSSPDEFYVKGFAVDIITNNWTDFQSLYCIPGNNPTLFSFFLNQTSKTLLEVPLRRIPAGSGASATASTTANNTTYQVIQSGTPTPKCYFPFRRGSDFLKLQSPQVFGVNLKFSASYTLVAAVTIIVHIVGAKASGVVS